MQSDILFDSAKVIEKEIKDSYKNLFSVVYDDDFNDSFSDGYKESLNLLFDKMKECVDIIND